MKNVLDEKKEKNLNFILPLKSKIRSENDYNERILVVVHLYYEDSVEKYLEYVSNVPKDIDILFTISSVELKKKIDKTMSSLNRNYKIIDKENRGRDISAFLVAARQEIKKYEYVCFVHDKKEKFKYMKEDVESWIVTLWENVLGAEEYISNIINVFKENENIGLLVPPTHLGEYMTFAIINAWYDNFDITCSLLSKLGVVCNMDENESPITLGTVFWARTKALKKLFDVEWKYEDFQEEPLPNDGTISHAIERCLSYVAEDAGYITGVVMTDRFAEWRLEYIQDAFSRGFEILNSELGVHNIHQIRNYKMVKEELRQFANGVERIYIYGAGIMGRECYKRLKKEGIDIEGFVITSNELKETQLENKKIQPLNEIYLDEKVGVIIAGSISNVESMRWELAKISPDFDNIYIYSL